MFNLQSADGENELHMRFGSDVTLEDIGHAERRTVVVARSLEEGFVLVADVRECESITRSATERVRAALEQVVSFGAAGVVAVADEDTPPGIERKFRDIAREAGAEVTVVEEWESDEAAC